jgi:hypothetical protein
MVCRPRVVFCDAIICLLTWMFQVAAIVCAKDAHSLSRRLCSFRQRSSRCGKLILLMAVNGRCPDTAKRQRRTAQAIRQGSGSSRESCQCRRHRRYSVVGVHFFHDCLVEQVAIRTAFAGSTAIAVVEIEVGEVYHAIAWWRHDRLRLSFLLSFLLAVFLERPLLGWLGGRVEPEQAMEDAVYIE